MKILSVVGARPNFMKIAPFSHAIDKHNQENKDGKIKHILLHTGQHYDDTMSNSFFHDLNIPEPDINLGVGSGTHAEQVGNTMIAFEKVLHSEKPDWVIVVGDVNATLACSVTAKKEHIKVCHVEAGLRSRDLTMPEEINRMVTDRLSDLLLTPDKLSSYNLIAEGVPENQIVFVGNIMMDTLEANREKAGQLDILSILKESLMVGELLIKPSDYFALMTMHRPSNVDDHKIIGPIIDFLINKVSTRLPLVWPVHPRTVKQLKKFYFWNRLVKAKNIYLLNPIVYQQMLKLNMKARVMLTDSGGIQEECCVLGTPCLTLRWNTERPVTLKENGGASILVGNDVKKIEMEFNNILSENSNSLSYRPNLWDGKTAERCLSAILNFQVK
jgi:UDP-N-acetylglucosamine 2-epimerase (non-hydrolysing)